MLRIGITDLETRVQQVNLQGTQALIDCLLPHLGIDASELVYHVTHWHGKSWIGQNEFVVFGSCRVSNAHWKDLH